MALRFFLEFDERLTTTITSQLGCRALWQAGSPVADVAGLVSQIQQDFAIPASHALRIAVHGYTVPPGSLVTLLRDNDRLQVFPASSSPALQHAVPGQGQTLQLTAATAADAAAPPALQGNLKRQRVAEHAAGLSEGGPAMREGQTAEVPAPPVASAEHATPQRLQNGTADSASSDDGTDEEGRESTKKAPSRSARRKKLKRQLRREGILPSGGQARERGHRYAGGSSAAGPAGNAQGPPQQPLPKRGETWAMSRAERRFASQGHVYFSDSDAEQQQQQPGSKRARAAHAGQRGEQLDGLASTEARAALYRAQQAMTSNGHGGHRAQEQAAAVVSTSSDRRQPMNMHQEEEVPSSPAGFDALPQLQQPAQGVVIGYRLLHIGADWTPQVSEWRKGRVAEWQEGTQMLTVEPWPDPSVHPLHRPAQKQEDAADDGVEDEDEDEDEGPPTDYDEDGVLRATLQSFHDVRLIRPAPQPPPAAVPGASAGEQAAAPVLARNPSDNACDGQPQPVAAQPAPAAEQAAAEEHAVLPNGGTPHAASAADCSSEPGAVLLTDAPNPGPPTPGGLGVPSIGAWMSVAAELRRRRAELAAQKGTPSHSSGAATPVAGAAAHASSYGTVSQPAGSQNRATELQHGSAQAPQSTPHMNEHSGPAYPDTDSAAADTGQPSRVDVGSKGMGSSVTTPGAVKPRPGVRASSVGLFLARLRAQDAEAVSE